MTDRILKNIFLIGALFVLTAPVSFPQRLHLSPHFHAGQTFFYRIEFKSSRHMKAESRVASPQLPPTTVVDASGILQVEIVRASAAGLRVKTYYSERNSSGSSTSRGVESDVSSSPDKVIEVSIAANGSASQFKGIDQLSASQQFAWNDWLSRFSSSMALPKAGIHVGQKWDLLQPEAASSPIGGLVWIKKYQYVRDEPCPIRAEAELSNAVKGSAGAQNCAVILVNARLRQKSSRNNATPNDYKLQNLKTRGTASGQNETILYISRIDGVLVRASENAEQSMDATVALANDSNQVHYILDAKGHSEIVLISDSSPDAR